MRSSLKPFLAAVLSIGFAASGPADQKPKAAVPTDAELAAALDAHVTALAAAGEFSGSVLLARGDTVLLRKAVGLASRETNTPNTPETKFNLGSINKAFTRLVIEQLAREGKLRLDDTIDRYVPEYPADKGRRITIAQLLDHRGGTGDFFGPRYDAHDRWKLVTLRDWLPLFADEPLLFEPGTDQRYSNAGYLLLGLVIEKATGQPYHDVVRARIFAPAGMSDTDAFPAAAAVKNRATGYTKEGGPLRDNRESLPALGSSAGGGYSTVDDMRRFAGAMRAGRLGVRADGLGIAGGAPGINAVFEMSGDLTLVVLGNLDPPAARKVASRFRELRGGAPAAGPGRRRVVETVDTGGNPEGGPGMRRVRVGGGEHGSAPGGLVKPARSVVPDAGVDVPMKMAGHMPAVHVRINGQGPFLFAIDTGGAGVARVDAALRDRLSLAAVGEVMAGDPSGKNPRTLPVVALQSLEIGGARFEGLRAAVRDLSEPRGGEKIDGVLGFGLFADLLLTLDYPKALVRVTRGALPPPDGKEVIAFHDDHGIPSVTITVGGREMTAHVDAGNMGGIVLPESEVAHLALVSAPEVVGRARTTSNTFEIKAATLKGSVSFAGVTVEGPKVEFQPVFPMANLGARFLRGFALTFDQKNLRLRVSRPAVP